MNLFDKISSAIHRVTVVAGTCWNDHVEPWLQNFLKNTSHDALEAVKPIAQAFVAQAIPALVTAIKKGDAAGFADAQWDILKATADAVAKTTIQAALADTATAVNALIVGHPDVAAATASSKIPAAPAPAAPSSEVADKEEPEEDGSPN